MNKKLVINTLGRILKIEGLLLILPLALSIYYRENIKVSLSLLKTIVLLLLVGISFARVKPKKSSYNLKDGFGIVSLTWFLMSFFGALPFVFSGYIGSLVDAVFETASGFTTTGATILQDVEALPNSLLFWRSFTHFIGGMGILIFALAIAPKSENDSKGSVFIAKAESPGPVFGKLVSKMSISAKILYRIYIIMTLVLILILILAGMKPFDAMIHAFGAAGTGGFSNKQASVAYFQNSTIEWILGVGMIVFGVNFNLYFLMVRGRIRDALKSEELKAFLGIILGAVFLICLNIHTRYDSFFDMLRDAFFSVSSIISTTGYATIDFGMWPLFSHVVLLLLMFIGSCAGSTAGGIKVSRVLVLFKSAVNEIKLYLNPRRVIAIRDGDKTLAEGLVKSVLLYLSIYVGVFSVLLLIVSLDSPDFVTAFSAVAATLNNIGPGVGAVGPSGNFAFYGNISKLALTIGMIMGRLELFPVLAIFMPNTWSKKA